MNPIEAQPIQFKPFKPGSAEGLKKFIHQFPRLPYGLEHFDSFRSQLTSSSQCVLDVWQGNQRVAVAMLLDKDQPQPQCVELALLGYRWDFSPAQFLKAVIPRAKELLQSAKKTELEMVSSLGHKVSPEDLKQVGFTPHQTTLTFESQATNPQLLVPLAADQVWQDATSESVRSCFELLKINFPHPEAAGLVPFEQFEALALRLPMKPRVLFHQERVIAFVWVVLDREIAQLLFMARHPDFKGKDLGRACLSEAVRALSPYGFKKLVAEVKETDTHAIQLFERSGFRTSRRLTRLKLLF